MESIERVYRDLIKLAIVNGGATTVTNVKTYFSNSFPTINVNDQQLLAVIEIVLAEKRIFDTLTS